MKSRIHPRFRWPGSPAGASMTPSSVTNSDTTTFFMKPPSLCSLASPRFTRSLRLFLRTAERLAAGGESQLRPRIGEVGVGLDPGNVRAVRVALALQQIKLRRGADLITVLGQARGVLAGLRLRASRFAVGDVGLHGIPVAVDRVATGKPGALLAGSGGIRRGVLRTDVREVGQVELPGKPQPGLPVVIAAEEPRGVG